MPTRAHLHRHLNDGYDPWATRVDDRVRCRICGFAGIDPETWQEPEKAPFTVVQTGDTYAPSAGDTVEDLVTGIDVQTETQYPARGCCPLCGSPRWADGSAPDLRW